MGATELWPSSWVDSVWVLVRGLARDLNSAEHQRSAVRRQCLACKRHGLEIVSGAFQARWCKIIADLVEDFYGKRRDLGVARFVSRSI